MTISKHDLHDHLDDGAFRYNDGLFGDMPEGHFAEVGRFMVTCARHEASLHRGLRFLIGIDETVARILIDQPRINQLTQTVVDLCTVKGWKDVELSQLRRLRAEIIYAYAVRNVVAHQSLSWCGDWLRFDKFGTARKIGDPTDLIYVTNLTELHNLSDLVTRIISSMSQLLIPETPTQALNAANMADLVAFKAAQPLPPDPRA